MPAADPRGQRASALDEARREQAVERLGLLSDEPDDRFDRVVRMARRLFGTGAAAFTVLHGDRQLYRARSGIESDGVAREHAFCQIAIASGEPLVIGDAREDPRFADNPLVHGEDGVRFYAGYPLRTPEGELIGALCLLDREPRRAEDVDLATLRDLALMIEAGLEHDDAR
jgi:GAF domain-containing protein